jgi:hypothetical protein
MQLKEGDHHRPQTHHNLSTSPLLRLPPELLELIFEELEYSLREDEWTPSTELLSCMRSCALACSALSPFTRHRLVFSVSLSGRRSAAYAHDFASQFPDLYCTARCLSLSEVRTGISSHWGSTEHAKEILSPLTRVHRLKIVVDGDIFISLQKGIRDMMLERMAQISHLTICRFNGALPFLVPFISHSPQLRSLNLVDCRVRGQNITAIAVEQREKLALTNLSIAWDREAFRERESNEEFVSWLCALCRDQTLRTFSYHLPPHEIGRDPQNSMTMTWRHVDHVIGKLWL